MSKQPHIYLFSGLGADEDLLRRISLPFESTFIPWSNNLSSSETIKEYAKRFLPSIEHENPILIGVSFGGIVAIELAKLISVQKVIIISSVKEKVEIPILYKLAGISNIDTLIPTGLFNLNFPLLDYVVGASNKDSRALFHDIINNSDPNFIKWSIVSFIRWNNKEKIANLIHIHGDNDKFIPAKGKIDYVIKGGGHLMVFDKADEVSKAIAEALKEM